MILNDLFATIKARKTANINENIFFKILFPISFN